MRKNIVMCLVIFAAILLPHFPQASATINNEMEIHKLIDRWTKAFEAKDINGVMAIYAPGDEVVAYDLVPPLQYRGADAYRQDYQSLFDQYEGPLQVESRDLTIVAGDRVAFAHGLEKIGGTLKNGQKTEGWVRVTECYRKINGRWMAIHDHVSAPINMETGKGELDLKP